MIDKIKNLALEHVGKIVGKNKNEVSLLVGSQDQVDVISYDHLDEHKDHVLLDDQYLRTHKISVYPRNAHSGWLDNLYEFGQSFDTSQHILEVDTDVALNDLERKLTEFKSTENTLNEKGVIVGTDITDPLDSASNLKSDLLRGQQKFFQTSVTVGLRATSLDELDRSSKKLEYELQRRRFRMTSNKRRHLEGIQTLLPRGEDMLLEMRNMNSRSLSLTFPFASSQFVQEGGVLFGISPSQSMIFVDRFALQNANSVTFAKSGSGKSYLTKAEISRHLIKGTKVIIIDPEREYKGMCQALGGTYINLSVDSEQKINPFDTVATSHSKTQIAEHAQNLIEILSLMMGGSVDVDGLDKSILAVYSSMEEGETPVLRNLYEQLNKSGYKDLCDKLDRYLSGTLSGIFNKQTNVDLTNDFIVFDIKDMPETLRPIMMMIVSNFVENTVKVKREQRMLVIDEAWMLLKHEESSRFITELTRRARKYWLGVSLISQDAEDFLSNKNGRVIVAQTSLRIIMRQSTSSIDMVGHEFKLSAQEKEMLLKSGQGEAIVIADDTHVQVNVIASDKEHALFTTNPQERALMDATV